MLRCNIRVRTDQSQIVRNILQRSKHLGSVTFSLMLFGAMTVLRPLNIREIANEGKLPTVTSVTLSR